MAPSSPGSLSLEPHVADHDSGSTTRPSYLKNALRSCFSACGTRAITLGRAAVLKVYRASQYVAENCFQLNTLETVVKRARYYAVDRGVLQVVPFLGRLIPRKFGVAAFLISLNLEQVGLGVLFVPYSYVLGGNDVFYDGAAVDSLSVWYATVGSPVVTRRSRSTPRKNETRSSRSSSPHGLLVELPPDVELARPRAATPDDSGFFFRDDTSLAAELLSASNRTTTTSALRKVPPAHSLDVGALHSHANVKDAVSADADQDPIAQSFYDYTARLPNVTWHRLQSELEGSPKFHFVGFSVVVLAIVLLSIRISDRICAGAKETECSNISNAWEMVSTAQFGYAREFFLQSMYHFLLFVDCVAVACLQYTVNCCLLKEVVLAQVQDFEADYVDVGEGSAAEDGPRHGRGGGPPLEVALARSFGVIDGRVGKDGTSAGLQNHVPGELQLPSYYDLFSSGPPPLFGARSTSRGSFVPSSGDDAESYSFFNATSDFLSSEPGPVSNSTTGEVEAYASRFENYITGLWHAGAAELDGFVVLWIVGSLLVFFPFVVKNRANWLMLEVSQSYSKGERVGSAFGILALLCLVYNLAWTFFERWASGDVDGDGDVGVASHVHVVGGSGSSHRDLHSSSANSTSTFSFHRDRSPPRGLYNTDTTQRSSPSARFLQETAPAAAAASVPFLLADFDHNPIAALDSFVQRTTEVFNQFVAALQKSYRFVFHEALRFRGYCLGISLLFFSFFVNHLELPFVLRHHPVGGQVLQFAQALGLVWNLVIGVGLAQIKPDPNLLLPTSWILCRVCLIVALFFALGTNLRRLQIYLFMSAANVSKWFLVQYEKRTGARVVDVLLPVFWEEEEDQEVEQKMERGAAEARPRAARTSSADGKSGGGGGSINAFFGNRWDAMKTPLLVSSVATSESGQDVFAQSASAARQNSYIVAPRASRTSRGRNIFTDAQRAGYVGKPPEGVREGSAARTSHMSGRSSAGSGASANATATQRKVDSHSGSGSHSPPPAEFHLSGMSGSGSRSRDSSSRSSTSNSSELRATTYERGAAAPKLSVTTTPAARSSGADSFRTDAFQSVLTTGASPAPRPSTEDPVPGPGTGTAGRTESKVSNSSSSAPSAEYVTADETLPSDENYAGNGAPGVVIAVPAATIANENDAVLAEEVPGPLENGEGSRSDDERDRNTALFISGREPGPDGGYFGADQQDHDFLNATQASSMVSRTEHEIALLRETPSLFSRTSTLRDSAVETGAPVGIDEVDVETSQGTARDPHQNVRNEGETASASQSSGTSDAPAPGVSQVPALVPAQNPATAPAASSSMPPAQTTFVPADERTASSSTWMGRRTTAGGSQPSVGCGTAPVAEHVRLHSSRGRDELPVPMDPDGARPRATGIDSVNLRGPSEPYNFMTLEALEQLVLFPRSIEIHAKKDVVNWRVVLSWFPEPDAVSTTQNRAYSTLQDLAEEKRRLELRTGVGFLENSMERGAPAGGSKRSSPFNASSPRSDDGGAFDADEFDYRGAELQLAFERDARTMPEPIFLDMNGGGAALSRGVGGGGAQQRLQTGTSGPQSAGGPQNALPNSPSAPARKGLAQYRESTGGTMNIPPSLMQPLLSSSDAVSAMRFRQPRSKAFATFMNGKKKRERDIMEYALDERTLSRQTMKALNSDIFVDNRGEVTRRRRMQSLRVAGATSPGGFVPQGRSSSSRGNYRSLLAPTTSVPFRGTMNFGSGNYPSTYGARDNGNSSRASMLFGTKARRGQQVPERRSIAGGSAGSSSWSQSSVVIAAPSRSGNRAMSVSSNPETNFDSSAASDDFGDREIFALPGAFRDGAAEGDITAASSSSPSPQLDHEDMAEGPEADTGGPTTASRFEAEALAGMRRQRRGSSRRGGIGSMQPGSGSATSVIGDEHSADPASEDAASAGATPPALNGDEQTSRENSQERDERLLSVIPTDDDIKKAGSPFARARDALSQRSAVNPWNLSSALAQVRGRGPSRLVSEPDESGAHSSRPSSLYATPRRDQSRMVFRDGNAESRRRKFMNVGNNSARRASLEQSPPWSPSLEFPGGFAALPVGGASAARSSAAQVMPTYGSNSSISTAAGGGVSVTSGSVVFRQTGGTALPLARDRATIIRESGNDLFGMNLVEDVRASLLFDARARMMSGGLGARDDFVTQFFYPKPSLFAKNGVIYKLMGVLALVLVGLFSFVTIRLTRFRQLRALQMASRIHSGANSSGPRSYIEHGASSFIQDEESESLQRERAAALAQQQRQQAQTTSIIVAANNSFFLEAATLYIGEWVCTLLVAKLFVMLLIAKVVFPRIIQGTNPGNPLTLEKANISRVDLLLVLVCLVVVVY
eukprot:CAMPEP_0178984484 /NCGR_PEP_ID=MMETSP0795-20121207/1629_1 /TAXON_ID=88552 /ORGANISM="Amoebophrya sp., Strain Ameob2" /LENGTH=2342 /DNA_ID=CAMNT_0020675349 /DNA_START=434 /DNA_END=7462 /DNA_ORIENTATION=+